MDEAAMLSLATIDWLAVLVAAVSTFVLGALWYGPLLGRTWMRASTMTDEKAAAQNHARTFGAAFLLQLVAAAVLAMFVGEDAGLAFGAFAGGCVGMFWVGTAFGVVYLFEQRPLTHWAVNATYQFLAFLLMGGILGAWQ